MFSAHCPGPDPLVLPTYLDIEELRSATTTRDRPGGSASGGRPTNPPSYTKTDEPEES